MPSPQGGPTGTPRNLVLRTIPATEFERLRPQLEIVELACKTVLLKQDAEIKSVYFPETMMISALASLEDGSVAEVGLVGYEGMSGLPLLLGAPTSPWEKIVQVEGTGLRLSAGDFRAALGEMPGLMSVLLRYVDAFQTQISQTAACNNRHHIEQRLARWILMTHDRVEGDSFVITQEFMSSMLGVRRPGVTLALGALQRAGLVQHERGTMRILDRAGLEAASCECYDIVRRRFAWLMQPANSADK